MEKKLCKFCFCNRSPLISFRSLLSDTPLVRSSQSSLHENPSLTCFVEFLVYGVSSLLSPLYPAEWRPHNHRNFISCSIPRPWLQTLLSYPAHAPFPGPTDPAQVSTHAFSYSIGCPSQPYTLWQTKAEFRFLNFMLSPIALRPSSLLSSQLALVRNAHDPTLLKCCPPEFCP